MAVNPNPPQQPNTDPQPQQPGVTPAVAPQPGPDTPPPAAQQPEPVPYARFKEVLDKANALERDQRKAAADAQKAADDAAVEQGKFKELAESRATKLAEIEAALRKERTSGAILRAATEAHFPVDVAERMVDVEYAADGAITTDIPAAIKALSEKYPQLVVAPNGNGANGGVPRPGNGGGPRPNGTNGLAPEAVRADLAKSGRYGL